MSDACVQRKTAPRARGLFHHAWGVAAVFLVEITPGGGGGVPVSFFFC